MWEIHPEAFTHNCCDQDCRNYCATQRHLAEGQTLVEFETENGTCWLDYALLAQATKTQAIAEQPQFSTKAVALIDGCVSSSMWPETTKSRGHSTGAVSVCVYDTRKPSLRRGWRA
jgi:hypothetical protein